MQITSKNGKEALVTMDRLLPDGSRLTRGCKTRFTAEEDLLLKRYVKRAGKKINWFIISQKMNTKSPRQCRDRYTNYLNPNFRAKDWTSEEEQILREKHAEYGDQWRLIAKFLPNKSTQRIKSKVLEIQEKNNEIGDIDDRSIFIETEDITECCF